jgi:hypothetical protein
VSAGAKFYMLRDMPRPLSVTEVDALMSLFNQQGWTVLKSIWQDEIAQEIDSGMDAHGSHENAIRHATAYRLRMNDASMDEWLPEKVREAGEATEPEGPATCPESVALDGVLTRLFKRFRLASRSTRQLRRESKA